MRFSIKVSLLGLGILAASTWGIARAYRNNAAALHPLTPTIVASAPKTPNPAKSTTASAGAKQASVAKQTIAVPNCVPGALAARPTAPDVSIPGLHEASLTNSSYTIYGNTVNQIQNQMYACSPIIEGSGRFGANTTYTLSWTFDFQGDGTGLCKVQDASVGLAIAQQYPNWQASTDAASGLARTWQNYISNLITHEMGHANIDRTYASTLLNDLRAFPVTDCSSLTAAVNAKAQSDVAALNAANEAYDASTNHGATQGAVL